MKETKFIEQNQKKWQRFEELYKSKSNDPEELSDLYMDVTDDLSYAQTFYKRRTVRVYLNKLAQTVYTGVHKQKGESISRFIDVWRVSLPLEIYRSRKSLLFALIAFVVYALIGVATTMVDPDFPRVVLGDYYVDMTIENIQNGNPLKIYEDNDQTRMFIEITTNNMKVAFLTFFVGFFFTIGTHILLFSNGVMLGAFQYFFHAKGLLITSFLGIWIHGAFEISAIVLAGGAGITAGNGLLFPKSYTRLQSLQLSTKRGLKIMMSLVPFIIAAGFLESFVTANYQDLPEWSKWALIFTSFGIILFFYVFYPLYVARKYPELIEKEEVGNFIDRGNFNFFQIRSVGEVLADSFRMYRFIFEKLSRIVLSLLAPIIGVILILQTLNHYDLQRTEYWYDWMSQLEFIMGYCFINLQDYIVFGVWTLLLTFLFTSIYWCISVVNEPFRWGDLFTFQKQKFIGVWIGSLLFGLCVLGCLTLPWFFVFIILFIAPFFFINGALMAFDPASFKTRVLKGGKFSKRQYGNSLLTLGILIVITAIVVQPIAFYLSIHESWSDEPTMRDLLDMMADFVKRVAYIFNADALVWSNLFRQIVYVIFLLGIIPLYIITMTFVYFNEREKSEALGLHKAFEKFGKRSNIKETKEDFE
ncbi:MAG: stage II sporulation protein M [Flavobacteriales bacterium]|nr:stage II sporulation protein M [Flavobacteriales bacterium]